MSHFSDLLSPFKWITVTQLFRDPPPPVKFIWGSNEDGLLQENSYAMLHASEKMGKSMFTLNLAVAGARGDAEFLGRPIRPGGFRTLIVQCEVHMRAIYERFKEMLGEGLTPEQLDRIVINTVRNIPVKGPHLAWLKWKIRRFRADVVVIDPLARMLETDENSNVAVGRDLAPLLDLRDDPGCSVLVVHHDAKVGDANAGRPAHQRSRGANRLTADPDAIWSLTTSSRKGGPTAKFSCTARYGKYLPPFRVRLNERTFWFETFSEAQEWGEAMQAIIIAAGGMMPEAALIEAVEEKWSLSDSQGRHRTAMARINAVVKAEMIYRYEKGGEISYGATMPLKEE